MTRPRAVCALWFTALACFVVTGALGVSAAVPPIGPRSIWPPYDLALGAPSWTVTLVASTGFVAACAALISGLGQSPAILRRLSGARIAWAAAGLGLLALAVPPWGSADHLSYLAYGRIALAGDDPYSQDPLLWHAGADAIAGAVQAPWAHTPSVYGPFATGVQALVVGASAGDLRLATWLWQVVVVVSWWSSMFVADRLSRHEPLLRARAALIWGLNPLLIGTVVFGAHVDALAVALGAAAIGTAVWAWTRGAARQGAAARAVTLGALSLAGALAGAAAATKITYSVVFLALVWAWVTRRRPPAPLGPLGPLGGPGGLRAGARDPRGFVDLGAGAFGAALVVIPGYWWAGPHAGEQAGLAAHFVSLAAPWKPVLGVASRLLGEGTVRGAVPFLALGAALALALALARAFLRVDPGGLSPASIAPARAWLLVGSAWLVTATYTLPWYDAILWWPLALVPATQGWTRLWALRLTVLALAYVPGRVIGLDPQVQLLTLGFRQYVAPALMFVLALLIVTGARAGIREAQEGPAGGADGSR